MQFNWRVVIVSEREHKVLARCGKVYRQVTRTYRVESTNGREALPGTYTNKEKALEAMCKQVLDDFWQAQEPRWN